MLFVINFNLFLSFTKIIVFSFGSSCFMCLSPGEALWSVSVVFRSSLGTNFKEEQIKEEQLFVKSWTTPKNLLNPKKIHQLHR